MTAAARGYHKARVVLFLLLLLGLVGAVVPFFLPPPSEVEITLRDEVFGTSFADKVAELTDGRNSETIRMPVEAAGGGERVWIDRIRSGPVDLTLEIEGYRPAVLTFDAPPLEVVRIDAALEPTFGRVVVTMVDARNKERQVAAALRVDGGDPIAARRVEMFLAPGEHLLAATAPDFCSAERTIRVREREELELMLPISPILSELEAARVIFDWSENPRDLDAHVLLSGNTFLVDSPHVYFSKQKGQIEGGGLFAELDVDHQYSEGFETITIYQQALGVYQYYIHHYAGEGTLGNSEAEVQVLTRGCKRKGYAVPSDCAQRWWYVVDLKVEDQEVYLIDRSECLSQQPRKWKRRQKKS